MQESIEYLGHEISNGEVRPARSKVEVLYRYDRPKTIKQLQSFLGLANYYRRFIKNFAEIASPLYRATEGGKTFTWSDECQESFDKLRNFLTTADEPEGVLILPDINADFRLETDACNYGVGACLSQKRDNFFRPVAYFSKHLNKAERRYSPTDKELLALVMGIEHFRQFLYNKPFTAVVDHEPLKCLNKAKELCARQMRFMVTLRAFKFTIEYRKGSKHGNADALSRWLLDDDDDGVDENDMVINAVTLRSVESNPHCKKKCFKKSFIVFSSLRNTIL